jgi:membrane protein DedA with SNARE-associated domain
MFEWITQVIGRLGYWGVAALTFLENLFPPIPSEVVIPLAGFVAAQGDLRLWLVVAAGSLGSLGGALFWYEIGRRIGERRLRRWVAKHGRWITLGQRDLDRAQAWFEQYGGAAVLLGRLLPGVRTFVSLPAGFTAMPLAPFLLYSAAGTVLCTAALAYAGVALESNFGVVSGYIDVIGYVLLAILAVVLARRYITCWREPRECGD